MRRLSMVCGVGLMLTLAASPVAMADPSWATASIELTNAQYTNVSNLRIDYSGSWASVSDTSLPPNSASDSVYSWTLDTTTASADIGTASGHGETGNLRVFAEFAATPPAGITSSGDWNRARQEWTFQATADGWVTFVFDLKSYFDIETAIPAENASATVWKGLYLYDVTPDHYSGGGGEWSLHLTEEDSSYLPLSLSFPDGVQAYFYEGDIGLLIMDVRAYGSATTVVPVPPAILLGLLGLGVARLKLRKYA